MVLGLKDSDELSACYSVRESSLITRELVHNLVLLSWIHLIVFGLLAVNSPPVG